MAFELELQIECAIKIFVNASLVALKKHTHTHIDLLYDQQTNTEKYKRDFDGKHHEKWICWSFAVETISGAYKSPILAIIT